jgi:hypothetical protein
MEPVAITVGSFVLFDTALFTLWYKMTTILNDQIQNIKIFIGVFSSI